MLYPKIKNTKPKTSIKDIINNTKNDIINSIDIFRNRKYFILFIKKSFHF